MRKFLILAAVSLGYVTPALACQWEYAPEPIGGPSAAFIAPRMAAQAAFIDLALAEGASTVALPPGVQGGLSQALSFRVLKRLKGQSADRFILFGGIGDAKPGGEWGMTHWVDPQGRIYPYRGVLEAQVALPQGMTSCDPPRLTVAAGRVYLVLREADGRLLGSVSYHPGLDSAGTPIALAGEVEPDDFTRQVMQATYPNAQEKLPDPVATAEPGRATIVFRRPINLVEARSLLQQAGVLPYGALISRGGMTTEYRLGSEFAFARLLDDAIAFTASAATPPDLVRTLAGRIVDRIPAANFDEYDPSFGLVPGLASLGERHENGLPAIIAIDVVADAAAQRRLARNPAVFLVDPGRRIRRAIAAGTVSTAPVAAAERAGLYPRLVRLAGKGLPGNAVDGRWRVTGSFEPFKKVPMTLSLTGGIAEATSDCFTPLRGSYRLTGLMLKMRLPKPDLTKCPKIQEYWSLDDLFGNREFTVRLKDDRLRLQGSAESGFSLERLRD